MDKGNLDVKIIPLEQLNPHIKRVKVHIAYPDKNRRKFDIPRATFDKMKDSLLGSPIVLNYFKDADIIGGHTGDVFESEGKIRKTGETHAYGFIAYDVEPWYETLKEADGREKEYMTSIGYVWETRFKNEVKHIYTANHSMEIQIEDAVITDDGYVYVKDASFIALCALNPDSVTPTFESSKFARFSTKSVDSELLIMKDELEKFSQHEETKMSIDWLSDLVEEISEIFGYDCSEEDATHLFEEFEEYQGNFALPKKYEGIKFKPPVSLAKQAQAGLDMRARQSESNKCCTPVGLARARQLINRQELTPSTVKRMKSFFDRHEVDKKSDSWKNGDSKAEQAWKIWGGDTGYRWAKKIVAQMDKEDSAKEKESFTVDNIGDTTDATTDKNKKDTSKLVSVGKEGMPAEFSMEGDARLMEKNMMMEPDMMKEMFMKYGMDKYMFMMKDDNMMYAMDMEMMKPMAMPYAMENDMAMPMMDDMKMAEDMMMDDEMMVKIAKNMYDMYMDKIHGYMSLKTDKESVEKDVEKFKLDIKTNEDKIEELNSEIKKFTLLKTQIEAGEILNHEDFSMLTNEDRKELIEKVEADMDMGTFKMQAEAFSFKKIKEDPNYNKKEVAKDDKKFSMDLVIDKTKRENKNIGDKDIYTQIKETYNFK